MGFWDVVTKPVRIVTAPITVPAKVVVNVVTGNRPVLAPVREVADDITEVAHAGGEIVTFPDTVIIDLSHQSLGVPGKIIAELAVGGRLYSVQAAVQTAEAFAGILQGQNPLEILAIPLASAIAVAASEFNKSADPVPQYVRSLLNPHYPQNVLDRARYTIGSLGINLPDVINNTQLFMGYPNHAVTVDNVIVFSEEPTNDAHGIEWWAHEMQHVAQYTSWGINKFAYKYITDFQSLENEAKAKARDVVSRTTPNELRSAMASVALSPASERTSTFRFYYQFEPQPGWRVWASNGDAWIELYPNGDFGKFRFLKETTVEGIVGIAVGKTDEPFSVFIANKNSPRKWLYFRHGEGAWQFLGLMHNVS